jgi:hypothetical protein
MNTPYIPKIEYPCFVVKVYDSKKHLVFWLNRHFLSLKSVYNSYIHKKDWKGVVYCIYQYPTYSFKELLTYRNNKDRVILTSPEAEILSGDYTEGWGLVKR